MKTPTMIGRDRSATPFAPVDAFAVRDGESLESTLFAAVIGMIQRRRLIAGVTAIGVLVGVAIYLMLPVRYIATTRMMPPQQTAPAASLLMNQLASTANGSLSALAAKQLGIKTQNDIYLGLLTSRPIADAVISQFDLERVYRARDMTMAREKLATNTQVISEKNGFISLSVTDGDKLRAPAMANAYTDRLRILLKTFAVSEASQRRLFYEDQLKLAKESLVTAEATLQQLQQKKGLIQLDTQTRAMIETVASLRAQITEKQVELQAIRSYSTESNPEVQIAERELTSLQQEAARTELDHSSNPGELGLQAVPGTGLEYFRAEHEVRYRQTMFDLLLKQYDAAGLDEAQEAAIIQVVEPAIPPDRSSSPKLLPILVISLMAGFFSGCLFALGLWWKSIVEIDPSRADLLKQLKFAFSATKKN